jgi:hypothetical protein
MKGLGIISHSFFLHSYRMNLFSMILIPDDVFLIITIYVLLN